MRFCKNCKYFRKATWAAPLLPGSPELDDLCMRPIPQEDFVFGRPVKPLFRQAKGQRLSGKGRLGFDERDQCGPEGKHFEPSWWFKVKTFFDMSLA